MNMPILTRWNG